LSRHLVNLVAADPRLREGLHAFECPMVEGDGVWLQPSPELQNPYMGPRMLVCGSEIALPTSAATGDVAHHTCPMHPSVRQPGPGTCPICGMDLVPVTHEE